MKHEMGEKISKPSEKDICLQREKAEPMLKSALLDDDSCAPASLLPTGKAHVTTGSAAPSGLAAASARRGQPSAAASASSTRRTPKVSPLVLASQLRAKSVKEYRDVAKQLDRALKLGRDVMSKDAVSVHGSPEEIAKDFTLDLLRARIKLVELASYKNAQEAQSLSASKNLFKLCLEDPYLKDLSSTFLTSASGCMTYGRITFLRDTALDIQPSVESVLQITDNMKNAMALLKKIATSLYSEAESWRSNVSVLHKAKKREAAATRQVGL